MTPETTFGSPLSGVKTTLGLDRGSRNPYSDLSMVAALEYRDVTRARKENNRARKGKKRVAKALKKEVGRERVKNPRREQHVGAILRGSIFERGGELPQWTPVLVDPVLPKPVPEEPPKYTNARLGSSTVYCIKPTPETRSKPVKQEPVFGEDSIFSVAKPLVRQEGFCYLACVKSRYHKVVALRVGKNPTALSLVKFACKHPYAFKDGVRWKVSGNHASCAEHGDSSLLEFLGALTHDVVIGNPLDTLEGSFRDREVDHPLSDDVAEVTSAESKQNGGLRPTPVVGTTEGLNEGAWLGDALLTLALRKTCLTKAGAIDQDWVASKSSNAFQMGYLIDDGYDCETQGLSVHECGQAFEWLYAMDRDFNERFNRKFRILIEGDTYPLERCWLRLFRGTPHSEGVTDKVWLKKTEVMALVSDGNQLSSARLGVEKAGLHWHVVDGVSSARDILNTAPDGVMFGGRLDDGVSMSEEEFFLMNSDSILERSSNGKSKTRRDYSAASLSPFTGRGKRVPKFDPHLVGKAKCSLQVGTKSQANHRRVASTPITSRDAAELSVLTRPVGDFAYFVSEAFRLAELIEPDGPLPPAGPEFECRDHVCWLEAQLFAGRWSHEQAGTLDRYYKGLEYWRSQEIPEENFRPKFAFEIMEQLDPVTMPFIFGWEQVGPTDFHMSPKFPVRRTTEFFNTFDPMWRVGLTTAVVLGTIGDVEPTLDVVAANHFSALTNDLVVDEWLTDFSLEVTGSGWCASDFLMASLPFARAMDNKYGAAKGKLSCSVRIWNEVCAVWGGDIKLPVDSRPAGYVIGAFCEDLSEEFIKVPDRPVGAHVRVLPDDFTLVTHPDHIATLKANSPEMMANVESYAVNVSSHEFIKLGQDILDGGVWGLKDAKHMVRQLVDALKVTFPYVEQSDLVYLVSGTTFHYLIGSLFPDKQVFEVCPVPREDNGVCPEFYLGHYASILSKDPAFSHEMGRMYNQRIMAPTSLKHLEWEGEFIYREPPKFHSIMPWAKDKWQIESPNVGFKPYDDFVIKTSWQVSPVIRAYFSLGSCEKLTRKTKVVMGWLRSLPVIWSVDPRWKYLFEGCQIEDPGFFPHSLGLHRFDWVVHHGGSGTTNTCLTVGVPQTILPQIGDQFVWRDALRDTSIPTMISVEKLVECLSDRRYSATRPSVSLSPSGTAVRSMRRYLQVDTRMLARAPNKSVGKALLDKIVDWDSVTAIEAFWAYTDSWPPHYKPKSNYTALIEDVASVYSETQMSGLMQDVAHALGSVLSVSSAPSMARRVIGRNALTNAGRGIMKQRWHVLVDALRHYSEFAEALGISVMPGFIKDGFPALTHVECTSVVHYKSAIHRPISTRMEGVRWMDTVRANGSKLMVHLFSLKMHALGPTFGVFHAVIEYEGKFYELQQLAGERTLINETRWQPEPTDDRPLVKTIVVSSDIVGTLDMRRIKREFQDLDYKVLGDNCLVFANFLVYILTGKVIPWKHFGVFGQDIELSVATSVRKWAVSYLWTDTDEVRCSIDTLGFSLSQIWDKTLQAKVPDWQGPAPRVVDYGLRAIRTVERVIQEYDRMEPTDTPWSQDDLLQLAAFGYKRFGLSSHLVSQAILAFRLKNIPQRRRTIKLYGALAKTLKKFSTARLAQDVLDVLDSAAKIRNPLREGRKPAWAPLLNISVPRHWFRDGEKLVAPQHMPENLNVQKKNVVKLDLPQIVKRYEHYFPGVPMPSIGFKFVRPGEYEIGVKVPLRKNLPKMDDLTWALVTDLQEMHPFEMGVFSLRFGTEAMAEKVTDRYFTGTFESGQLIPEVKQQELADAIFRNERALYENAQLISPEEVYKKWHKNYSAGFPFRFNAKGNAKRQALVDAAGGKEKFLEAVRAYIESPECFPTVSHAFIKDEVLPSSYIEREKIRTIIAQDPLNYFAECAVQGDHAKRQDPTSFSAVGVSPAHGELAALAEKHLAYKHHFAMDVTALDSTAAVDAIDTIKKLRYLGFQNHPNRDNIKTMIDGTLDNLQTSWIIDIHTGKARLKKQGLTTGHAATTPNNTEYMKVMMLYAWGEITGRPYDEFYDVVKFSSFSDDNFWSTSLPKSVFSAELISKFWLSRGVIVRVEGESDNLADLSFLAKRFSFDPVHLEEVRRYAQRDAKVAIVHDVERLLQKFSDYKSKNTLGYRWQKLVALQANCAHHKDIYDKVSEYLDALERTMTRRQFMRKHMRQNPRKTYDEIMHLMYSPKNNKSGLIVSSLDDSLSHRIINWWDQMRVDIMTFDSTVNSYGRVLQTITGLLEIGGLNVEDPGVYLRSTGELPEDKEMTLEHHVWLLNGCPSTFEQYRSLVQKTPFSAFCNADKFWAQRDRFDVSEECANGLRAKVFLLQGIYTVVAWLEKMLYTVPVIGPIYRVFCTAKGLSEVAYSRLNALYYAMFGDSSLVLSAMMPKDRYFTLKVASFKFWTLFTGTDLLDFGGDLDQFRGMADASAKLAQDVQSLVFDLDISSLVPRPDNAENGNDGTKLSWVALDHSHSVNECMDLLSEGKEPIVTGPTGCGKSTDFIVNLADKYNTVLVACPRRVLVTSNPIAQKRLYSGSKDKLVPGLINFGTSGYFRQILGELDEKTILVLDEFHELNEDTLWLHSHFKGKVICVSATPSFSGSERFSSVQLTKSRNSGHSVLTEVSKTKGEIADVWDALLTKTSDTDKVLCIVPTVKMVQELTRHAIKLAPNKRCCELFRGHDEVFDADWYFATSIVDAGITIPNLTFVIDCGWSLGWSSGSFTRRPSSHNTMDQRKGRTGRMCDGRYLRLIPSFNDEPWDFTTPFLFNNWEVVKLWNPKVRRPVDTRKALLGSLPIGYEELVEQGQWSMIIYLVFWYANRGDINRTRSDYQNARKYPESPDIRFVVGNHSNEVFQGLHVVESRLRSFRIPNSFGNVWLWDGSDTLIENFSAPVPKHLQDYD